MTSHRSQLEENLEQRVGKLEEKYNRRHEQLAKTLANVLKLVNEQGAGGKSRGWWSGKK